jgi:hypothetical protein
MCGGQFGCGGRSQVFALRCLFHCERWLKSGAGVGAGGRLKNVAPMTLPPELQLVGGRRPLTYSGLIHLKVIYCDPNCSSLGLLHQPYPPIGLDIYFGW